jgi:hypothetical protein
MTPKEPLDDDVFINANFCAKRADTKSRSQKSHMINPVSSTSAASQAVAPQNTAQSKPQQATSSDPKDSVQLSPRAQTQASGDVDHDGDSH